MRTKVTKKRLPQRTCVACRKVSSKREMVRLVRVSDGNVEIDSSGRKAGRGAYLCPAQECWQVGLSSGRLEHALRTTLTQGNREQLIKYGKEFPDRG
jgi:hypothetical protein